MTSVTSPTLGIGAGTWINIAITYNGDTVTFYENGAELGSASLITTLKPYMQNQIGNNYTTFGGITIQDQFLGYIDELYMDSAVQTALDINAYYNSTK